MVHQSPRAALRGPEAARMDFIKIHMIITCDFMTVQIMVMVYKVTLTCKNSYISLTLFM